MVIDRRSINDAFSPYFAKKDIINNNNIEFLKIYDVKMKNREELMRRENEKKEKQLKEKYVLYQKKGYNEKEIHELDFEEAIIHDKRKFCDIFWFTLKQKQIIISTFFKNDPFKPRSIQLSIILFSFLCYFLINGFLYNEDYIRSKLETEEKSFSDTVNDSIERIVYTSLAGGLISFIIELLFNIEKKIGNIMNKKKNNIIILKGEISQAYKFYNITTILFIILQFITFTFFIIYIFCFHYVYPNNILDWFVSSLIIIIIIQIISIFTIFLVSLMKYLSLKIKWQLCYNINMYLYEQL